MEKNTLLAILFSSLFLIAWWFFAQPRPQPAQTNQAVTKQGTIVPSTPAVRTAPEPAAAVAEQEIVVENENVRAVFTTAGAAVKHWYLKEKNGATDLVMAPGSLPFSTFSNLPYRVVEQTGSRIVFAADSPQGWSITKTYDLATNYLNTLTVDITKRNAGAPQPTLELSWGPGLGTDIKEHKDNLSQIRALGFPVQKPRELHKFKPGEYPAGDFKWVAVDNRYFLAAFILTPASNISTVSVYKNTKKDPAGLILISPVPPNDAKRSYQVQFYLGPKGRDHLRSLKLDLDETIDFGFFGFLGKLVLNVLLLLHKWLGNYGWAIIVLTVLLQIIVLPLTVKSFKASAAMKQLQPLIRDLQEKYKSDPKRLNAEMLNLYRTQKVNPLGGCLPMLLQLPIFWALFTTLRNAYELRGAPWVLWVKDLSAPDALFYIGTIPFNVLPLIMGVGMFFQQKMMSVTTDPTQARMMYLMPVIFTFMFWGFPSGLVLYWLTNSVVSMIEQYVIMRQQKPEVA
jgi:YidC/Oxa1 family membrane protein insertase